MTCILITAEQSRVAQFSTLGLDAHYRTGERDPVGGFYQPCLSAATRYARAVGYFRSSIFSIIGQPFLEFASRGGTARLVCSPSITEDDAQAIASGYVSRDEAIAQAIDRDILKLLSAPALGSRTKLLATLIQCGVLDIRLAVRTNGTGIYNEKIGIFTDGVGERVSFLGSANETWSAWHSQGNHESIEVFREWVSSAESERVQTHASHFERLWEGVVSGVDTVAFPEAQRKKLLTTATNSLDGIDVHIEQLLEDIQQNLFNRAKQYRDEHITKVDNWDAFVEVLEVKGGFAYAHWDGTTETELAIKEKTKATIRCIPLDNDTEDGVCIMSGKPSTRRVLFAKAY